jgi:hypothetical protein
MRRTTITHFAYASSSPCTTMSNNCNAVGSTSNAINDSNNHIAVGGSNDDITSLSYTNQSLQPNVSASESSSFIGPIAIPNRMPTQKSRGTTLGRIHQMVKTSVPFLMNVYLVLVAAVDQLPQGLICLNQLPSCLSIVLVGSQS